MTSRLAPLARGEDLRDPAVEGEPNRNRERTPQGKRRASTGTSPRSSNMPLKHNLLCIPPLPSVPNGAPSHPSFQATITITITITTTTIKNPSHDSTQTAPPRLHYHYSRNPLLDPPRCPPHPPPRRPDSLPPRTPTKPPGQPEIIYLTLTNVIGSCFPLLRSGEAAKRRTTPVTRRRLRGMLFWLMRFLFWGILILLGH